MDRETLIAICSSKIRLVRKEFNLTQDAMADVIGLSKKTLVQIEKDRALASWTVVVALCALFERSEVLRMVLGDDPMALVDGAAFEGAVRPKGMTAGGKVFWHNIRKERMFTLQKHVLTGHYRIIDGHNRRWASAFDKTFVNRMFDALVKEGNDDGEDTPETAL
jgi:DNA-binding XRE family transcriptional regulator